MASSSDEAQAISAEIFVQCFRQLSSMPHGEAAEILDRQMIGVFQDRYFRPSAVLEDSEPSQADEMGSAIRSMAPMERLVFLLHDVYGYAVDRVAELTGLGETECCRSVFQGRMHVRASLA
jgi:DNA-directed RNA polymerase specialized sigma24 family protein